MAFIRWADQQRIQKAIHLAESLTSGEIRVSIEKNCPGDPLHKASYYFKKLGMDQTSMRHGVLIYIALKDKKFAIIGDTGIDKAVPKNFWDDVKTEMLQYFMQNQVIEGILIGIQLIGKHLQKHFPHYDGDKQELPNKVVIINEKP